MKLIVGLGNPGTRYTRTRHNVGRRLVETLASRLKASWKPHRALQARVAEVHPTRSSPERARAAVKDGLSFLAATPELFMNVSGEAVRLLVYHFKIDPPSDLLVVVDDVALSFGRLRLRASGQDGGHKGLRSVEAALGNQDYARLRIGIAPSRATGQTLEKYVLSVFRPDEEKELPAILERGIESCLLWLTAPIERAMDRTNALYY